MQPAAMLPEALRLCVVAKDDASALSGSVILLEGRVAHPGRRAPGLQQRGLDHHEKTDEWRWKSWQL
jgi:hypothetical protein